MSSLDASPQDTMTSTKKPLENMRSSTELLSSPRRWDLLETGSSLGIVPPQQSRSLSPIDERNLQTMDPTSWTYLEPQRQAFMTKSLSMIEQLDTKLESTVTSSSQSLSNSQTSIISSFATAESDHWSMKPRSPEEMWELEVLRNAVRRSHADAGMMAAAAVPTASADTSMSVQSASRPFMSSKTASPVPDVPELEKSNPAVNATLTSHPHLFKVVSPIKVNHFQNLLKDHPNQAFVEPPSSSAISTMKK
ncbi:hypothetical protein BKA93DRAFT_829354 [Sparassis latifolia]